MLPNLSNFGPTSPGKREKERLKRPFTAGNLVRFGVHFDMLDFIVDFSLNT